MYTGHAHWDEIAAVVDALDIPVLGNGDIKTPQDAMRMRAETSCAGVMIARGSFGQPWIFDQTRDLLEGRAMRPDPSVEQRFAVALDHARMAADYEPDRRGAAIEFRKHLGWYVKGLPGSAELRKKLHAVTSLGEVEGIFDEYLQIRDRYTSDEAGDAGDNEPLEAIEV
jgi:tRNA-dihydrouridine synthase